MESDWLNASLSVLCLGKLILLSSYLLLSLENDVLDKVSQLYLKYIEVSLFNFECFHMLQIFPRFLNIFAVCLLILNF